LALWIVAIFKTMNGRPIPWWGVCAFAALMIIGGLQWVFYLDRKAK